jgi:hypothetical protein
MTAFSRLTGEGVFLRPPTPCEAQQLLARLPRMQWGLALSCPTKWPLARQDGQAPASERQSRSSHLWYRIETFEPSIEKQPA